MLEDNQKDVTDFELELTLRDHIVLTTAHEDHELFLLEVQLHELIPLTEHLARDGALDHLCSRVLGDLDAEVADLDLDLFVETEEARHGG